MEVAKAYQRVLVEGGLSLLTLNNCLVFSKKTLNVYNEEDAGTYFMCVYIFLLK